MEKIKECPFCGSNYVHVTMCSITSGFHFKCLGCKIDVIVESEDSAKAISIYNRRITSNEL